MPRLSLIAALAANNVIGRGNALPWHLPDDLKRFKAVTLGHPVIMGRKTFDSIVAMLGKPLPGRDNIVISRSPMPDHITSAQVIWSSTLQMALIAASRADKGSDEAFVIGGSQIYELALPQAQRLYLTEVKAEVDGDAHFPARDPSQWRELSREAGPPAAGLAYDFVVYERR